MPKKKFIYEPFYKLPEEVALDIVGDIHGEYESFERLLSILDVSSYKYGLKSKRLLVINGDCLDRGPNSYRVFLLVKKLVESKKAVFILGNHESNVLRGDIKDGAGWFFGVSSGNEAKYEPCYHPSEEQKQEIIDFLDKQPIAAYRSDIRIVHAYWNQIDINKIRTACRAEKFSSFRELYAYFSGKEAEALSEQDLAEFDADMHQWGPKIKDPENKVPYLSGIAKVYLARQWSNPVRVLNSGAECHLDPNEEPFYVGGEWRMIKRDNWWEHYDENVPVVIGHYWRRPPFGTRDYVHKVCIGKDEPFNADSNISWFGRKRNVFCIDYSVGKQFINRMKGFPLGQSARLAALRWPEKELVFECGTVLKTN